MSLTLRKRRVVIEVPSTWMGRMKVQAKRAGGRLAPMADQARTVASSRIEDARYWAAPKLEDAAHRVEDQFAPRVSAMLTQAAKRVDPSPARSRRWPVAVLMTGLALGAMGYMFYRRNAQQWTDHMKDSAADASRWVSEKADRASDKTSDLADEASKK
ncbi:hypothetical protein [Nonomuraea sp. NPDC050310]|uniref:hypothetical protein n=1 Tax=unclassified Nonomuraea TaxID=2593643 RepID=UPI00340ED10B